ncbi:MAG: hypothetical protein B7Z08_12850 [Sphingomonadales bacterium 32-68-7]|nr:MAG: hypothetical protein B7Z08_12850 [Sphingomonadales bacterium 32-68-7]
MALALASVGAPGQQGPEPTAAGAVEMPDTPAGKIFAHWLAAFNGADRAGLEAIRGAFAPGAVAPPADAALALRERSGGFEVRKIEESNERRLVVLMQARGEGNFVRTSVELDPEGRILSMPLRVTERPPEFAIARLGDPALAAELGHQLEAMEREGTFSGAVLVLQDGQPVFNRAYGFADRERQRTNRTDGKFRIGSMGKMFTSTAVVQLIQAGKIKLSDPLSKFLPDYPNAEVANVTIEQLLTHTGGTGDIFTPEFFERASTIDTLADYIALFGDRAPAFVPGSRYQYSNYGYVLLGRVIEVASGESYYDYLQRHLFDLAGMTSTGFWRESQPLEGRVVGYEPGPNGLTITEGTRTDRASPAGGAISSLEDLARFARALLDHKLLDAKHTDLLFTGRVEMGPNMKYALGFGDTAQGTPLHWVGHNGAAPGQNGVLQIYPEAGYTLVVLSNFGPPTAQRVADFIGARLGG